MNETISHTLEARDLHIEGQIVHRIDHAANAANSISVKDEQVEFSDYLKRLISDASTNTKGRKYKVRSLATQVVSTAIKAIHDKDFNGFHESAKRLLENETKAQKRVERLDVEILGGILLHASIIDKGIKKVIICKAENSEFLNDGTFKRSSGYPIKRRIYRSVQFVFNEVEEITDIAVFDSSTKGASYWWDGFLELDQHWDDKYNTERAFDIIDKKALAGLKEKAPADHMYLRNSAIRYFRSNGAFDLEEFIDKVVGEYQPVSVECNVESLKNKIREFPGKYGFDAQFDLVPSSITARIKTILQLSDNIELIIKKDIDIPKYVTPVLVEGQKYIRIRTDVGYDAFQEKKDI